jgi:hypothetical protein
VVLANQGHGACLRTLNTLSLSEDQPDFAPDVELIESLIGYAVLVEIDFLTVWHFDKPVIRKKSNDFAMAGRDVEFNGALRFAYMVLELAACRVKGVANGHIDILMRVVERSRLADKDILSRHAEIDADIIELAVAMVTMRRFDRDPAAYDAIMKPFEFGSLLANASFDRWRWLHTVEAYLQGHSHRRLH